MTRSAVWHFPGDDFGRGVERADSVPEPGRQFLEACQVDVEHGDVGLQAHGHLQGIRAGNACADHHHSCRSHSRHAAEQHAPAGRHLQVVRADLGRHATGDTAHGLQQRQRTLHIGYGLVGDGGGSGSHQRARLFGIGRQVQVGEENLSGRESGAFIQLRFLDLDDHLRGAEHRVGVGYDFGAGGGVLRVLKPGAHSSPGLDQHVVSFPGESGRGVRCQSDPVLVNLDFLRNADPHFYSPRQVVEKAYPNGRSSRLQIQCILAHNLQYWFILLR